MQQQGGIKHPAQLNLADHFRRQRMIVAQLSGLDPRQDAHGTDGMLVHRIDVVHIVLHLGHDATKIQHETAQHTSLVHAPQGGFRVAGGTDDFQK